MQWHYVLNSFLLWHAIFVSGLSQCEEEDGPIKWSVSCYISHLQVLGNFFFFVSWISLDPCICMWWSIMVCILQSIGSPGAPSSLKFQNLFAIFRLNPSHTCSPNPGPCFVLFTFSDATQYPLQCKTSFLFHIQSFWFCKNLLFQLWGSDAWSCEM